LKYVSLEDPSEFAFAQEDPKGFLARFAKGAVFDEAQRWPALFSYLQGMVDEDRTPGRFVLTGSQQFGLLAGITQSLAGRVGLTRLLPLSLAEIPAERLGSLDEMLLRGGYPALYAGSVESSDWLASYVATYVERDVRQVLEVRDLMVFQRFLRLCAARTGQLLNLNALAGEEAAIVTAVPGTTRDTVHRAIVIDGMLLNVIDTAGLRDTTDEVEAIGIERTRRELARADLVLHMVEAAGEGPLDALAAGTIPAGITRLKVINKIDTCGGAPGLMGGAIGISAKSGAGLDVLRAELLRLAGLEGAGEDVVFARERHMAALNEAAVSVEAANDHLGAIAPPLELLAEELRHAQEALGAITGEFSADDLLGEIFGRFCIGK
jgi:hypothetical protein